MKCREARPKAERPAIQTRGDDGWNLGGCNGGCKKCLDSVQISKMKPKGVPGKLQLVGAGQRKIKNESKIKSPLNDFSHLSSFLPTIVSIPLLCFSLWHYLSHVKRAPQSRKNHNVREGEWFYERQWGRRGKQTPSGRGIQAGSSSHRVLWRIVPAGNRYKWRGSMAPPLKCPTLWVICGMCQVQDISLSWYGFLYILDTGNRRLGNWKINIGAKNLSLKNVWFLSPLSLCLLFPNLFITFFSLLSPCMGISHI